MTTPQQSYRTIHLTQNQSAIVDASDFGWLNQWKWYAAWNSHTESFYAVRRAPWVNGKECHLRMHRVILGLNVGDQRSGDHANRDTLDNRRSNLRIASRSQNMHNRRAGRNNTSGFKGVCFYRPTGRWLAAIGINNYRHHLGFFDTPEQAHAAYCEAAAKYHGEFARTK